MDITSENKVKVVIIANVFINIANNDNNNVVYL